MKRGRLLGAAVLIVIALAVAWPLVQDMNDQAYRTAVGEAFDEVRPILAELTVAAGVRDLDRVEKMGSQLSDRAHYWQTQLTPMPVSKNLTQAKAYWSSVLTNLNRSGDAYVRAARQERAGQTSEAADSWNYAEEYMMAANEQWPHAAKALTTYDGRRG